MSIYLENGWERIHELFGTIYEDPTPDELNFVLFSVSGVCGSYMTIEDIDEEINKHSKGIDILEPLSDLTFLIIQPRLYRVQYGNLPIRSRCDLDWLKKLREKSKQAMCTIGCPDK